MSDQTKYVTVSQESVRIYAESAGISDLPESISKPLAEDVCYRAREVAQNAAQFMKHAKRRRLSTQDLTRALRTSCVEAIYGHGSDTAPPFRGASSSKGDVFFVDDKEMLLRDVALDKTLPSNPGRASVKAHWLAVNGQQTLSGQSTASSSQGKAANAACRDPVPALSEDGQVYYDLITKALLGNEEPTRKLALEDIRTSPKIGTLLPYFINFIATGVKAYNHNLTSLHQLLKMVSCLVDNQSLHLEPYVIQLVTAVMNCLLESLTASTSHSNDHWMLRDTAARILAHIDRKCSTPVNLLHQKLLITLQDVFQDETRPHCSHYGAIVGLNALGAEAIEKVLIPHLDAYWAQLQSVIEDQDDGCRVKGALLQAAETILKSKQQNLTISAGHTTSSNSSQSASRLGLPQRNNSSSTPRPISSNRRRSSSSNGKTINEIYQQLYEIFGDSLNSRIIMTEPVESGTTQGSRSSYPHLHYPIRQIHRDMSGIKTLIQSARQKLDTNMETGGHKRRLRACNKHIQPPPRGKRKRESRSLDGFMNGCVDSAPVAKKICLQVKPSKVIPHVCNGVFEDLRTSEIDSNVCPPWDSMPQHNTLEVMDMGQCRTLRRGQSKIETGKIKRRLKRLTLPSTKSNCHPYSLGTPL